MLHNKYYILFDEWNSKDLERVCRLAEKRWFMKDDVEDALKFEWTWILRLNSTWYYQTSYRDEESLKIWGYKNI